MSGLTERIKPIKGPEMQKLLAEHLKSSVPYIAIEKSNARFDLVAYLPDYVPMEAPPSSKIELGCVHRYRRYFCSKKIRDSNGWMGQSNVARYSSEEYAKWDDIKGQCKCPNDPACEHYQNQYHKREDLLGPGLHIFEIKSDLDTHERLAWQIPQMMYFADYVWLVLGDYQPVPVWLMPWVGIIRYANGKWIKERSATGINNKPAMYWQVLTGYGFSETDAKKAAEVLAHAKSLERAWMINSVFHWGEIYGESEHGHIVDMERYMYWAHKLINKLGEVKKVSGKDRELCRKEEEKSIQRTLEAFLDETFKSEEEQ